MHKVNLNTAELVRIITIFIMITMALNWIFEQSNYFRILSSFTTIIIMYLITSIPITKKCYVNKILGKPVLHGLWKGKLYSNYQGNSEIDIYIKISQSYSTTYLDSFTEKQNGRTEIVYYNYNSLNNQVDINYIYKLEKRYAKENHLTKGAGELKLVSGGKKLIGEYWTNSPTEGTIELDFVGSDNISEIQSFNDAILYSNKRLSL